MSMPAASSNRLDALPGPRGWPLLGNIPQIDFTEFHLRLEQWSERYGRMYRFHLGRRPFVVVSEAETLNDILKARPDSFRRRRPLDRVFGEMGVGGLFSAEGDDWRRQRKLVAMALNSAHLHRFYPDLMRTTERLRQRWNGAADGGKSVALCPDLMRYTVDVTTQLAFGLDFNTLQTDGPVIQHQLDKVFPMIVRRMVAPLPYWRLLRLPRDRALDQALVFIRREVEGIIAGCRREMENDPTLYTNPRNFLEAIIAASAEEDPDCTDADIFSNTVTLLLAGEDTTANTLAWCMNYFLDYPELYRQVRAEVDEFMGPAAAFEDHQQLAGLRKTEAFALETMRLKPVAPFLALECNHDIDIDGVHLPQGTAIVLLLRRAAADAAKFERPQEFNPGRWLEDVREAHAAHDARAFMPFGTGPRFCPGRNLAMLEIKVVLAMVARNFDLTRAPDTPPVHEHFSFTMGPENLLVCFAQRADIPEARAVGGLRAAR